MKIMDEKKYNHIELNNEVTKRKDNGFFNHKGTWYVSEIVRPAFAKFCPQLRLPLAATARI
jgi:hypothetical protein